MSDTKASGRKKKNGAGWSILFFALIGAACGVLILSYLEQPALADLPGGQWFLRFAALLITMYAAMLLQIIIHEAGHLVFGLLSGYRFCSFRIFGLMLIRESGHLRLRRFSIPGTGGQCLMGPPELRDGRMPVMRYNLGGVLLNLISSLVFLGLSLLLPAGSFWRVALQMLTVMGVAFAIMNGLPLHLGPVDNDGCNARTLGKGDPDTILAFWAQMRINEEMSRGVLLQEMPEDWFRMPTPEQIADNAMLASWGAVTADRLLSLERYEEADRCLEALLVPQSKVNDVQRGLMVCERICLELLGEARPEVLEGLYTPEQQKLMKAMTASLSVIRTQYALALLRDRDEQKAEEARLRLEKQAAVYPWPREVELERRRMALAREKYEQMKSPEAAE